jgi:hypothetical protein
MNQRPAFDYQGEKAECCFSCKKQGMVNVADKIESNISIDGLMENYANVWSLTSCLKRHKNRPIRLLDIKKTLDGNITFVSASSNNNYCAISYTWMSHEREKNSEFLFNRLYPFYLSGLKNALQVCLELGHDCVWIDALCIDQNEDSKEKSREIPNMKKYYEYASECVIFPDGLNLDAGILQDGRLPKWFTRTWTIQEYLSSSKRTFVFGAETRKYLGYNTVAGEITEIKTKDERFVCIDSQKLAWFYRLTTDMFTGKAPFKAPETSWRNINRESAFMIEHSLCRRGDILQRSMFRESTYPEDKLYSLLSLFDDDIDKDKIEIRYDIGLDETLRMFARAASNDLLAHMMMCCWYSETDVFNDIHALPHFEREKAAVWFNMGNVIAKCRYIELIGLEITSQTKECVLESTTGDYKHNMFSSINHLSDMAIEGLNFIELEHGYKFRAYGRCQEQGLNHSLNLVTIGMFSHINSTLTGAMNQAGEWTCCLICSEKSQKIGICVLDINQIRPLDDETVIVGYPRT